MAGGSESKERKRLGSFIPHSGKRKAGCARDFLTLLLEKQ
jgi:hypothetical protein